MDLKKLKLFLSLSETLHFGRSSEECHVSPSALSRTIAQLEESMSVVLFIRDNRSVSLTPQGKKLQRYARETLGQWDNFQRSLAEDSQELQGELRIYCSVTASHSFLYDILSDFRQQHPKVALKLHTGDPAKGIARIKSGLEDITIAARPENPPQHLTFKRITISELVFICAKSAPHPIHASDLEFWASTPLILSEEGLLRERVDAWLQQLDLAPPIYAQVAGHEAIVSMVSLGFGIGAVPKIVLDNSPLGDRVDVLPHPDDLGSYDVSLCTLKKHLKNPIIEAFWNRR